LQYEVNQVNTQQPYTLPPFEMTAPVEDNKKPERKKNQKHGREVKNVEVIGNKEMSCRCGGTNNKQAV
jgi:hypothetical protein